MVLEIAPIKKNIRKSRQFLKKAPSRPVLTKSTICARKIRRFEAVLEALNVDSKRNERRLLRRLGRIRNVRGNKDMDVLHRLYVCGAR